MCSFSEEMFLRDFFTFDAVVGRFCDSREIFDCLVGNYYIESERADRLFTLATSKNVCNVSSLKDYKRYRRLRQYATECKLKQSCTEVEDDVLTIKGKALYVTSECGLIDVGCGTKAGVYASIVEKAKAGVVTALRLYGILQCEGIFFEKSVRNGVKNLKRTARWNSVEGVLSLLKYDETNRGEYLDMLYTLTMGTPYEDIAVKARSNYGIKHPKTVTESILLSKVFGRGQINRNVYLPAYANLLYSKIVPFKDKEKLLLSESKEAIASYIDLPLKLSMSEFAYDVSAIADLPLTREEEQGSIIRNVVNSDIRHLHTFRPLCLSSDSKYMRNYYASAITKLFGAEHVENICVADLSQYDFEPGMNNVFVRSCDEDKGNVFIFSLVGEINEAIVKSVCDFLQSAKREKMRLVRPSMELDLSAVMPICLCDRKNAQTIAKYCDRVDIANPDKKEQGILIRALVSEKEEEYGISNIDVEFAVMEKLCSVSIDAAGAALDLAIAANRDGKRKIKLTEANASKYIKKRESSRGFGYGGCEDDN